MGCTSRRAKAGWKLLNHCVLSTGQGRGAAPRPLVPGWSVPEPVLIPGCTPPWQKKKVTLVMSRCNTRVYLKAGALNIPASATLHWLWWTDPVSISSTALNIKVAAQNAHLMLCISCKNAFQFYSPSLKTGFYFSVCITNESLGKWKISPPVKKAFKHEWDHK